MMIMHAEHSLTHSLTFIACVGFSFTSPQLKLLWQAIKLGLWSVVFPLIDELTTEDIVEMNDEVQPSFTINHTLPLV